MLFNGAVYQGKFNKFQQESMVFGGLGKENCSPVDFLQGNHKPFIGIHICGFKQGH